MGMLTHAVLRDTNMETKASKVRRLVKEGHIEQAIKLAASFTRDFDRNEQRVLQIAKEVINGHTVFYSQIGIDTQAMLIQARELINNRYK